MILVTLGTHPQPMDRLVQAMDDLAADGAVSEEVVFQAAAFGRLPSYARVVRLVPYPLLRQWIVDARIVITHGGPGSIAMALAAGKRPLVVARDPRFGEHVDDHQLRFVRWLAERRPITPVWDLRDLGPLLCDLAAPTALERDAAPSLASLARVRSILHAP